MKIFIESYLICLYIYIYSKSYVSYYFIYIICNFIVIKILKTLLLYNLLLCEYINKNYSSTMVLSIPLE